MSSPTSWQLSLPEELVLLSHLDSGRVHHFEMASMGCAMAEIGELALRRRIQVPTKKNKIFGLDAYCPMTAQIELHGTGRTGMIWADELLTLLRQRSAAKQGRVRLWRWMRERRREAFALHQEALVAQGLLQRVGGLGKRHHPDRRVRGVLVENVRAAMTGRVRYDEHMLFLADLVNETDLDSVLGCVPTVRHSFDRARGTGSFESVPADARHLSSAISGQVPSRRGSLRKK